MIVVHSVILTLTLVSLFHNCGLATRTVLERTRQRIAADTEGALDVTHTGVLKGNSFCIGFTDAEK